MSDDSNAQKHPQVDLLTVEVTDERVALNVLIGFLGLAQKRGTFAVNESAKIYEAIKKFIPDPNLGKGVGKETGSNSPETAGKSEGKQDGKSDEKSEGKPDGKSDEKTVSREADEKSDEKSDE